MSLMVGSEEESPVPPMEQTIKSVEAVSINSNDGALYCFLPACNGLLLIG